MSLYPAAMVVIPFGCYMIEDADQETVKRKICGTNIYSLTWHQLTLSEFALVPCAQHATSLLYFVS